MTIKGSAADVAAKVLCRMLGLLPASRWSVRLMREAASATVDVLDGPRRYRFAATSALLLWRAKTLLSKEPETVEWIRKFSDDEVLFDIGANVGVYSVFAGRLGARVYAFEPESANFAVLNRNIALNELNGRVTAYPFAIADTMRLDSLRLHSTDPGAALHVFGRDTDFKSDRFEPAFEQGAMAITLDQLVFELGLPMPTHIKIDVDGLEPEVLRGAPRVLAHPDLRGLLLEINERQEADIAMAHDLVSLGFRIARKGEPVIDSTGRARMVNYVFARD
jgi:FkbM family methyltransferase